MATTSFCCSSVKGTGRSLLRRRSAVGNGHGRSSMIRNDKWSRPAISKYHFMEGASCRNHTPNHRLLDKCVLRARDGRMTRRKNAKQEGRTEVLALHKVRKTEGRVSG